MCAPERTCFLLRSLDLCSLKNFSSAFICPWKEHWIFCTRLLSAHNHYGFCQYNSTTKLFLQKILSAHNKDFCFLPLAKTKAPCLFSVFHALLLLHVLILILLQQLKCWLPNYKDWDCISILLICLFPRAD